MADNVNRLLIVDEDGAVADFVAAVARKIGYTVASVRSGAGFGGFGGARIADTPTLVAVAEQTGGTYHPAKDADQLREVFAELPKEVATQRQQTEITWMLAALGALLAAAAVAASIRWSPYP